MKKLIQELFDGKQLDYLQAQTLMDAISAGGLTPEQISAAISIMRYRGETATEVAGFVKALMNKAEKLPAASDSVIDVCGTGGDGANTFNISTAVALLDSGNLAPQCLCDGNFASTIFHHHGHV